MGGYTDKMEDRVFQWGYLDDCDGDYSKLIAAVNSADFFRSFGEGLLSTMQQKKPDLAVEDAIKFLDECCIKTGVPKSNIARSINTLKNWFKGEKRPPKGEDSRGSMFALAFAMQLTPDETAELFHKVYLDRAFDYRNEKEIIYYFCLRYKKSWADAKRLIEISEGMDMTHGDCTVYSSQIKADVESLVDEEAVLYYIAKHGHNMKKKSVAAKSNVRYLVEKARETVESETMLIEQRKKAEESHKFKSLMYAEVPELEQFRNTDAQSLNHIYEVITGCSVRGSKGTKTLFKNAHLPKEIKSRFPQANTLSKKDPTYEELRKLIILLASYNYWYQVQNKSESVDVDDYIAEMNVYLDDSGFSLMYYGNPYDWLFMYCSLSNAPLDTFRGILAEILIEE